VLTPEESKYGAVETRVESRKCADLFRANRDRIDGVIVTLPNFGEERAIADTLRLADLNVPVLIQATPDSASKMSIKFRRDSFCGKMSACNNLTQYGIPYSITTQHTEAPDSDLFRKDLAWFAGVCRVVKGMRRVRIGALGARPAAFNTVRYSEKILEERHLHRDRGPLRDPGPHPPHERQRRCRASQAGRHQELCPDRRHSRRIADQDGQARRSGRRLDETNRSTMSAVQCWTAIEEYFGVVPCTVMSMMSNDLLPSACEVDICGVVGMYALQLASGTPSALLDWNNNYGEDPDKAVCFHCSNLPKHFFSDVRMDFQEIIAGTVGKLNTFGTCVGR
jgi:L-fucose isomerase-like protein